MHMADKLSTGLVQLHVSRVKNLHLPTMDQSNELSRRRAARAEGTRKVKREIEERLNRVSTIISAVAAETDRQHQADRAFDDKRYIEAAEIYVYAVGDYWPKPVFTTRLAACYNALGRCVPVIVTAI